MTLPQPGASEFYADYELPGLGDGTTQFHSAYTATAPATDQNCDAFFSDFTEDMILEQQAYYNSWMDVSSDYQNNPTELLDQALFRKLHTIPEVLAPEETTDMLDLSFVSQSRLQPSLDIGATTLAVTEDQWQGVVDTPSTMGCQSVHVSPPQWMAVSNHELKTEHDYEQVWDMRLPSSTVSPAVSNSSASLKEVRQGKSKSTCRGAVVKKKHVSFPLSRLI